MDLITWIILYHHRHGTDAWIHQCDGQPDIDAIADGLDDFEPDRDEYIDYVHVLEKWKVEKRIVETKMVDTSKVHKCVICFGNIEHEKTAEGHVFWTEGSNAWPVVEGQCCQICNDNVVLPRRLKDAGLSASGARGILDAVRAAESRTVAIDVESDDFRRT